MMLLKIVQNHLGLIFEDNIDRYDERESTSEETEETIIWLVPDELIDANEAIELDWNPELEDFTYFMKSLAEKNLQIEGLV